MIIQKTYALDERDLKQALVDYINSLASTSHSVDEIEGFKPQFGPPPNGEPVVVGYVLKFNSNLAGDQ